MTRRPLTLADVLREELQWVRSETSTVKCWIHDDWRFTAGDVYEPLTFLSKIARSKRCVADKALEPDRYQIMADLVECDDYHQLPADEASERLAKVLTELVADPGLFAQLLTFKDFEDKITSSPRRLHLILTDPDLRATYLSGDPGKARAQALLRNSKRLVAALDDGETIMDLLSHSDVRDTLLLQPAVFGPIIDSAAVRAALDRSDARTVLRHAFGPTRFWDSKDARRKRPISGDRVSVGEVLALLDRTASCPPLAEPVKGAGYRANALLLEVAFDSHLRSHRDETVMLERFSREGLFAVCLSGGGIRSATFNLGVLQGLSRLCLLPKIDYLSTVSGGGYIGSWLSSWIRRHVDGADGVCRDLASSSVDPIDPEPSPVGHLREYSNYLAPRPGFLGADLWSIFATYARNLLLNWTMLLPPLVVLLILPRLYESWILYGGSPRVHLWIGRLALLGAMAVLGFIRPAGEYVPGKHETVIDIRRRRKRVGWFVLLAFLAAVFLTAAWAIRGRNTDVRPEAWSVFVRSLTLFGLANVAGAIVYLSRYYLRLRHSDHEELNVLDRRKRWRWLVQFIKTRIGARKLALELLAPVAATMAGAGLVYLGARLVPASKIHMAKELALSFPEQYAIGAIPLFLLILFVESTLLVGIVTIVSSELEREWWARAAAITLLFAIAWLLVSALAIVGPALLTQSPAIISALGGAAGVVALIRGHGDKTKPKENRAEWKGRLLTAAAAVALVVVISGLSLLVSKILTGLEDRDEHQPKRPNAVALIKGSLVVPPGFVLRVDEPVPSKRQVMLAPRPATGRHIETLRSGNWYVLLVVFAVVVAIALVAAVLFDVNTYSMHGMYRNRLIRAYLGASRWFRRPEPFTGFDPQDDLLMAQLRPEYLWSTSFHDLDGFLLEIKTKPSFYDKLPPRVQDRITSFLELHRAGRDNIRNEMQTVVFGSLNQMMRNTDLETGCAMAATTETLRRNRDYLETNFARFIRPRPKRTPIHIINTALNLVRGDNLAWQERKAESFTVTPLHSGSAAERLAFRDSADYGGPRGISLGTAMAISGAAVSANMGYNSSPTVTALMTLFNARLGWWLGNPGPESSAYPLAGPRFALRPLLDEAFGNTNDQSKYVFLSDGGHFENLGLYEMTRRRCRLIVVCDAAADPEYAFGDLANAVRKIRIDLGIPIEFETFFIGPDPNEPKKSRDAAYCAIGTIRYRAVASPRNIRDGRLIYIKPVVYSDCPIDVVNYSREGKPFPQESTADQFFSETQFESYRELGAHIIGRLAGVNHVALTPAGFLRRVMRYQRSTRPS